jgi:uncharacterized protein YukE
MSMDDTFREMKNFHQELRQFNDLMKVSMNDLQQKHDRVDPYWQDEMRKEYDYKWREFDEMMKRYLSNDGPKYDQFLDSKLRHLSQYLRSGR